MGRYGERTSRWPTYLLFTYSLLAYSLLTHLLFTYFLLTCFLLILPYLLGVGRLHLVYTADMVTNTRGFGGRSKVGGRSPEPSLEPEPEPEPEPWP